jgi:hypothetical protein
MTRHYLSFVVVLFLTAILALPQNSQAQDKKVRASLHAVVTQQLGLDTDITIDYSRPGVKGRVIWGELVPYGMAPGNKYSDNKPFPWRAGANKSTTIEFNNNLLVEGQKLPAGKYSIHIIPSEKDWIIIFNKTNDTWGSYKYDEKEDALRVTVTPAKAAHMEWLTFGFDELAGTAANMFLWWEKLKVNLKIELDGEEKVVTPPSKPKMK